MKTILMIIGVTMSMATYSQNCEDYISSETDKLTGRTTVGAKESLIISDDGKTGIVFYSVLSEKGSVILQIRTVGGGCIDDNNTVNILFTDGSLLEVKANSKFNCKSSTVIYFGGVFGRLNVLKELSTKNIETIRVATRNGRMQKNLTEEQADTFRNTMHCLSN